MKAAIENRRRLAGQGGFTLIELLVVIAILAVLAGVVVFAVGGINDSSQESSCEIEERTIKTAIQAFRADTGEYPSGPNDTTDNGQPFVGGLLDEAPDTANWTINYSTATPPAEPTLTRGTNCPAPPTTSTP